MKVKSLLYEGRLDRLTEDCNLKWVIVISSFFSFRIYKHLAQSHVYELWVEQQRDLSARAARTAVIMKNVAITKFLS